MAGAKKSVAENFLDFLRGCSSIFGGWGVVLPERTGCQFRPPEGGSPLLPPPFVYCVHFYSSFSNDSLTYVLERFLKLCEWGEARLNDRVCPLAHLWVSVPVATDGGLDALLDDVGHLVNHELGLYIDKHCYNQRAYNNGCWLQSNRAYMLQNTYV